MIALFVLASAVWRLIQPAAPADSARVVDGRLVIEPLGVSFMLPAQCRHLTSLGRMSRSMTDLVCDGPTPTVASTHASLDSARAARSGQVASEFEITADSILPSSELVAYLGTHALVGQAYVTPMSVDDIVARIRERGPPAVARFLSQRPVIVQDSGGWRIAQLSWEARGSDYSSTEIMRCYIRDVRGRRVVMAFADLGESGELVARSNMLGSIRDWP